MENELKSSTKNPQNYFILITLPGVVLLEILPWIFYHRRVLTHDLSIDLMKTTAYCISVAAVTRCVQCLLLRTALEHRFVQMLSPMAANRWIFPILFIGAGFTLTGSLVISGDITSHSCQNDIYIASYLITYLAIGPIAEEYIFRGVLYGWLRSHMRFAVAALLSAILFTLAHAATPYSSPYWFVFAGAIAMAYVYEKSRSLALCAALHAASNLSIFLFKAFDQFGL